jgi:hypothetical protein
MFENESKSERIPAEELERHDDAEWALHTREIQERYEGQWVVAYQRKIIAHGSDPKMVAEQAAQQVKGQAHRLVFCGREDPATWFHDSPDMSVDFTDA